MPAPLIAQGKTPEEANTIAEQDPQVIAGINAVKDATRRAEEEELQITIETERARVAETERGSKVRLAAEQSILTLLQAAQQQGLVGIETEGIKAQQDAQKRAFDGRLGAI